MNLNIYILIQLQALYPDANIQENTVSEYITTNFINVPHLILSGEVMQIVHNEVKPANTKVAIALNTILIQHLDSVDEFFALFDLTAEKWQKIANGEIEPKKKLVKKLIKEWNIKPSYILDDNNKML
jgi:hypothetical protein